MAWFRREEEDFDDSAAFESGGGIMKMFFGVVLLIIIVVVIGFVGYNQYQNWIGNETTNETLNLNTTVDESKNVADDSGNNGVTESFDRVASTGRTAVREKLPTVIVGRI